jgi:NitT/TauT family transport system substrate-binding protein
MKHLLLAAVAPCALIGSSRAADGQRQSCSQAAWSPRLKRAIHHLVAGVLLALLAGCGADRTELRLAISPWAGYEFLFLAKEKGFFADEGLDVRLIELSSLSDCRVAFESGRAEAMACTLIEVLQARDQSEQVPQVVLVTDYSNGSDMILGRKEFTSMADLKGLRVGLQLGSLDVYFLARALEREGLTLADVKMVACTPEELPARIASGELDAVLTYPPTSMALEAGGQMRRLFSSADIPGEIVDIVAVEAAVLRRQPGIQPALGRAFQRALDYAAAHPEEAYALMGKREGMSAPEFAEALKGMRLVDAAGQNALLGPNGSLQRTVPAIERVLRETRQITGADKPDNELFGAGGTASK